MRNLFIICLSLLTCWGCVSSQKGQNGTLTQGIEGQVTEIRGNQMPLKGAAPSSPKPLSTTIYFYEPTTLEQVTPISEGAPIYTKINTRMVTSVTTDSLGNFKVALPIGVYSVFVAYEKRFFANLFDEQQNIQLVTVEENRVTRFNIEVNANAVY